MTCKRLMLGTNWWEVGGGGASCVRVQRCISCALLAESQGGRAGEHRARERGKGCILLSPLPHQPAHFFISLPAHARKG